MSSVFGTRGGYMADCCRESVEMGALTCGNVAQPRDFASVGTAIPAPTTRLTGPCETCCDECIGCVQVSRIVPGEPGRC